MNQEEFIEKLNELCELETDIYQQIEVVGLKQQKSCSDCDRVLTKRRYVYTDFTRDNKPSYCSYCLRSKNKETGQFDKPMIRHYNKNK